MIIIVVINFLIIVNHYVKVYVYFGDGVKIHQYEFQVDLLYILWENVGRKNYNLKNLDY